MRTTYEYQITEPTLVDFNTSFKSEKFLDDLGDVLKEVNQLEDQNKIEWEQGNVTLPGFDEPSFTRHEVLEEVRS